MRISLIASRGLLILAILLPWPAWSQTQSTPPVVPGNTRFAFKLFHSLVSKTPDVNAQLADLAKTVLDAAAQTGMF